jgi:hypothetical protein
MPAQKHKYNIVVQMPKHDTLNTQKIKISRGGRNIKEVIGQKTYILKK